MSATADLRNRAARRTADRAARRNRPTYDQLMLWADIEEAKARERGRALPSSAVHPDNISYEFATSMTDPGG
jgi:hypothetical protein